MEITVKQKQFYLVNVIKQSVNETRRIEINARDNQKLIGAKSCKTIFKSTALVFQFAFSFSEDLDKQLITDFKKNPTTKTAKTKTKNTKNKISSR